MRWYVAPSADFVALEVRGKMLTTSVGTAACKPKASTDIFDSFAAAEAALEARSRELLTAGHVECTSYDDFCAQLMKSSSIPWRQAWNALLSASQLEPALAQHFGYLVSTDSDRARLEQICAQARSIALAGQRLVISFDRGAELLCDPPSDFAYPQHPEPYRALMRVHEDLRFPDEDGIGLRYEGPPDAGLEIGGTRQARTAWCVVDGDDGWFFHPTETNADGQPVVCFWSHDGGAFTVLRERSPGSLFLEQVARRLG